MGDSRSSGDRHLFLVARKPRFGLPTACPSCLPVYLYLKLANADFTVEFDSSFPDSDHIPYVEYGESVALNNEKGGVIELLKEEAILDLNAKHTSLAIPDLVSTKAMVSSWLYEAILYELWIAIGGDVAHNIYFSDLPWPIGKILHWKKIYNVKKLLGVTKVNCEERELEIYKKANEAYEALSLKLGDQVFFFDNRPTDVDALFLGHALFVLHALPETSELRSNLLKHDNLVKYAEHLKAELQLDSTPSSTQPSSSSKDASTSSAPRRKPSSGWGAKPNPKPKKEKTEEEKKFRRRAKYFLATQLVAVLVFLSLMGVPGDSEMDDEDAVDYDEE
ncbi:metaxin-like protein [Rhynchospora pubera]|uniref:Metaxin n=1 Tax=Rhynchospora pubera TaxID=906938 RepID=A0AAV8GSV7_9POAL|nr:metaxin-like protein [Rhynchospora pubera]KAJ4805532.1 metaxin-like protein [Rhynchospora pubera]